METKERFASLEDKNWEFSYIPEKDRLNVDRTLCGMLKLQTLMKNPDKFWLHMGAEHDVVHFFVPDEISEEDAIYLLRCGIFFDTECDGLSTFT